MEIGMEMELNWNSLVAVVVFKIRRWPIQENVLNYPSRRPSRRDAAEPVQDAMPRTDYASTRPRLKEATRSFPLGFWISGPAPLRIKGYPLLQSIVGGPHSTKVSTRPHLQQVAC